MGDGGAGTVYNNQFFIVVKYTIASAGGVGQMWINPVISPTEPTPTLTHTAVNKIRTSFEGIMLQQHSNNNTPLTRIDEIRVGTSWAAVVGASLSVSKNEIEGLEVYPNPAKDYLIIKSNISKITTVEMYNVLGAKVVSSTALVDNRLNVSSLAKGVYVLKINADASSSSRKIVIE